MEDGAGENEVDRVKRVLEGGDDAEVAPSAAEAPEEVGVLVRARRHEVAARRHDVRGDQVVARKPALARQPADSATEREPCDTGVRNLATRRREPVRMCLAVELPPLDASLSTSRSPAR